MWNTGWRDGGVCRSCIARARELLNDVARRSVPSTRPASCSRHKSWEKHASQNCYGPTPLVPLENMSPSFTLSPWFALFPFLSTGLPPSLSFSSSSSRSFTLCRRLFFRRLSFVLVPVPLSLTRSFRLPVSLSSSHGALAEAERLRSLSAPVRSPSTPAPSDQRRGSSSTLENYGRVEEVLYYVCSVRNSVA